MTTTHRLWQSLGVIEKEAFYLRAVIARLFPQGSAMAPDTLQTLLSTPEGIDRLESFVGKFSRMQDTLVLRVCSSALANALHNKHGYNPVTCCE